MTSPGGQAGPGDLKPDSDTAADGGSPPTEQGTLPERPEQDGTDPASSESAETGPSSPEPATSGTDTGLTETGPAGAEPLTSGSPEGVGGAEPEAGDSVQPAVPESSEPDITEPARIEPPTLTGTGTEPQQVRAIGPASGPAGVPMTPFGSVPPIPPPGPDGEAPAARGRRRLRWVTLSRVAWSLVVVGLLGIGGTGGWLLRGWLDDPDLPPIEASVDRPVILSDMADALTSDGTPNVLGLPEDEGRQVFANLGVSGSDIRVEEVPASGQPGLVVAQRPAPGAPLEETATLFVSVEAEVPDIVGLPEDEAHATLADLGARIVIERVYDEGVDEGTVITVEPDVGEPLGDTVTLRVGAPPSSVFLVELSPVESDCSTTDSATLGGTAVGRSLVCQASHYGDEPAGAEYVLNRRVSFFEATIGIDDRSSDQSPIVVRVLVDGEARASEQVAFGDAVNLRVPVSGALRLRIEVTVPGDPDDPYASRPDAVIGDARLVGARDAIDALVLESE